MMDVVASDLIGTTFLSIGGTTKAVPYLSVQVFTNFGRSSGNRIHLLEPGPRLNIKTVLSTYGDFHVKDKTAVRTSYL